MKTLFCLFMLLTMVPVSIITMMWGWGLSPHNWGWITFGYVWMVLPSFVIELNRAKGA